MIRIFLLFLAIIFSNFSTAQVTIEINWEHAIRQIPSIAYGVNSSANFIPSYSNNSIFMDNLELITQKKGLIRMHGWGMIDSESPEFWLVGETWNATKIKDALTPLIQQGYEVMINIPSGPLGEADYQDADKFAEFCASLVKVINVDLQLNIKYWEIPNEREQGFASPGLSVNEMSNLIKKAAQSMKAIDASILVGGPATAWVNVNYLSQLVQLTPDIDFITCHTYSGDCSNSLQDIYDVAQYATTDLRALRQNINAASGGNYIPIFLTEHNLSYQGCDYIQSNEGAVYEAIILAESMVSGIEATCYWNVAPYSDMSFLDGDEVLGNAHLYEIFNKYFHGEIIQSHSSDSTSVIIYATQKEPNNAFCLINRTAENQVVNFQFDSWSPEELDVYRWNEMESFGTAQVTWAALNNNYSLPPYSVNIFVDNEVVHTGIVRGTNQLMILPNPTKGEIFLSAKGEYQIYSTDGWVHLVGEIGAGFIDLNSLKSGLYLIRVVDGQTGLTSYGKVILQ